MQKDGRPVEIRLLQKTTSKDCDRYQKEGRATYSGVFDSANGVIEALQSCNLTGVYGIYFSLNAMNEAAARRKSWGVIRKAANGDTVSDSEITHRDWLLVDFDPERTAGSSATDQEKGEAVEVAKMVLSFFKENGLTTPTIYADSGNGVHYLWRLDMDNTPEDKRAVENFLNALSTRFSTNTVKIDTSVFNASRICKLYGTTAAKGTNTQERPHRLAQIVGVENQPALGRDQLNAITVAIGGGMVQESPASTNAPESPILPLILGSGDFDKVASCVRQLEKRLNGEKIPDNRDLWVSLSMSFASLGESAVTLFLRFSSLWERANADEDREKFLHDFCKSHKAGLDFLFKWFKKNGITPRPDFHKAIINPAEDMPAPVPLLSRDGIPLLTRKNILGLTGPAKAGKTTIGRAMLAATLSGGNYLGFESQRPLRVLAIDTEQSPDRVHGFARSVLSAAAERRNSERFAALSVREYSPAERFSILADSIEELRPDVVFIDGIADMINDPNDLKESESMISQLLTLTSRFDCGVIVVIHTNPNSDKARGHAGSAIQRKCETLIEQHHIGGAMSAPVEVVAQFTRNAPFPPFVFELDSMGGPRLVGEARTGHASGSAIVKAANLAKTMTASKTYAHKDLLALLRESGESDGSAKRIITTAREQGFIEKIASGDYLRVSSNEGSNTLFGVP